MGSGLVACGLALRAGLFYAGYAAATIIWASVSLAFGWMLPPKQRFQFIIGVWTRAVLLWLRLACGIRAEVDGRDQIPARPCIVLCHHESTWETLFLQTLFHPLATLIKRELLWIPFFGWAFALTKPIAIDRGSPRSALKRLIMAGRSRLAEGFSVLLFPEGTRLAPGTAGPFQPGGAALAAATGAEVVIVAHNAGRCWPAHRLRKRPGVIKVKIGPPIATAGCASKQINGKAQALMAQLMADLPA